MNLSEANAVIKGLRANIAQCSERAVEGPPYLHEACSECGVAERMVQYLQQEMQGRR
jgi:hypothetical protein